MALNTRNKIATIAAALSVAVLTGAGCSDADDEDAGGASEATTTTESDGGGEGGELDELCALATTISEQDEFPTAAQIGQYQELAPPELADATQAAGTAIIENEGDFAATFAALAEDEVEAATVEINTFESENCGIEYDESELAVGPNEPEDGAAVVEVTASEYTFDIPEGIATGRTSFLLTNAGAEAHFLGIARILQGTVEEALSFEGDPEEAGLVEDVGDSLLAAPGGEDVEVVTGDLEPGTYAAVCFIPGPDGTPHAFMGMAVEFTVG